MSEIKNYAEIRELVSRVIPGTRPFIQSQSKAQAVKEKGRKSNYHQYDLLNSEWVKQERLLKTEQIDSFLEISLRAAACPMPFNGDVWDGLKCPFSCRYCFADAFRASLYTAFFDNSKSLGLRHCNPDYYKSEMDKMLPLRGKDPQGLLDVRKAFAMEIPIRLGIRFEDFLPVELKKGVSLEMLRYLKSIAYPVMINTKSWVIGEDEYVKALSENPAGAAVHITVITPNDELNKAIEPGAPTYAQRLGAMKNLSSAGVRVVARIEPYMFLINDHLEDMEKYAQDILAAGVKHITFDTYSYSAHNPGIRQNFINQGYDFDRMFLATSDSQKLGSLLLSNFMDEFRKHGISCSTFDIGNVPTNDMDICCCVSDWFKGGWNYGSIVMAIRFIKEKQGKAITWQDFYNYVHIHGGFLSPAIEKEVHEFWNMEGTKIAYSPIWAGGMVPVGWDEGGLVWAYLPQADERKALVSALKIGGVN